MWPLGNPHCSTLHELTPPMLDTPDRPCGAGNRNADLSTTPAMTAGKNRASDQPSAGRCTTHSTTTRMAASGSDTAGENSH